MSQITDTAEAPAVPSPDADVPTADQDAEVLEAAGPIEPHSPDRPGALIEYNGNALELPIIPATEGSSGMEISKLLTTLGRDHPGSRASPTPGRPPPRSPTSTATPGSCATAGTRSSSSPSRRRFLETSYLLIHGELPEPRRAGRVHPADQPAHHAARGPQAVLRRLPAGRAPDAGAVQRGQRAVDLLPGRARPVQSRAGGAVHHPAAGEAADDRRLRLQEVRRAAAAVPGQLPRPGGELPADVVRLPGRAVRGEPEAGPRAGPAADPARRPRAELLDLDGPAGRLVQRQPVRVDLGRASTRCSGRCTAGPTRRCWRCSRGSAATAATWPPSSSG